MRERRGCVCCKIPTMKVIGSQNSDMSNNSKQQKHHNTASNHAADSNKKSMVKEIKMNVTG
jgi:hypothetical protein